MFCAKNQPIVAIGLNDLSHLRNAFVTPSRRAWEGWNQVRDRQNLNWKMRSRVKVIVFGTSLYRFTVYPDCMHPLANCVRKAFLHLHFSVWSIFDCPVLSFVALQLYGMVWYMSMQLQITVAPNKFESSCWKKSGWALTATCSMPFIHSPASG